jgi:hypothetical protein
MHNKNCDVSQNSQYFGLYMYIGSKFLSDFYQVILLCDSFVTLYSSSCMVVEWGKLLCSVIRFMNVCLCELNISSCEIILCTIFKVISACSYTYLPWIIPLLEVFFQFFCDLLKSPPYLFLWFVLPLLFTGISIASRALSVIGSR